MTEEIKIELRLQILHLAHTRGDDSPEQVIERAQAYQAYVFDSPKSPEKES